MAAKQHERTLQMMENFISLHNEGYSVKDIAEKYNLSLSVVYKNLGTIAEKAGVTRKELLEKPFIADHSGRNFTPVKPIDRAKFEEDYAIMKATIKSLREDISMTIEYIEETNQKLQEEMEQ